MHIETTPEGAAVFLDDRRVGTTPFQSDNLPAGEHRLRLAHRYFESWEQAVRLENDVVERIQAELQRGEGRVTVITDPPGAEVLIDDRPQSGETPLTLSGLRAGEQDLEIRLPRHRTITRTVEILPDDTARLDLALEGGDLHEWEGRWLTGEDVIPRLLEAAENDVADTRLMAPEGDNAWEKYQRVLDIDQDHPQARSGIEHIAERYVELADAALTDGKLEQADAFLANAETAGASGSAYDRARSRLQTAQDERRAEEQRRQLISDIQGELARLGRELARTGELNAATTEAIRAYERAAEQPERGQATDALLSSLKQRDRWPAPQPGDVFQDCPDCPEMVMLPAGILQKRDTSSPTKRQVNLPAFGLSKTEVTYEEWDACVADEGCEQSPIDSDLDRGSRPAVNVSWDDVQEYVRWLSQKTGEAYRLPSENEWEYAARTYTTRSNFFDLESMSDSIGEWVEACWVGNPRSARSGNIEGTQVDVDCNRRIVRGGVSPNYGQTGLSSKFRFARSRGTRANHIGFRVVRLISK